MNSPSYIQITTGFLLLCTVPSWGMDSNEADYNKMSLGFITRLGKFRSSIFAIHPESANYLSHARLNEAHQKITNMLDGKANQREKKMQYIQHTIKDHQQGLYGDVKEQEKVIRNSLTKFTSLAQNGVGELMAKEDCRAVLDHDDYHRLHTIREKIQNNSTSKENAATFKGYLVVVKEYQPYLQYYDNKLTWKALKASAAVKKSLKDAHEISATGRGIHKRKIQGL